MRQFFIVSLTFVFFLTIVVSSHAQAPIPGTWLFDQNENKVDDRIEQLARQHPDSLIGIIVDLRHPPSEMDVGFLENFGEVNYVMQYIPSIALRRTHPAVSFQIAEHIDVVMVELDARVYAMLDVSARAIRAKNSSQYSPQTAWEAGFRGNGVNIAILDTGVDDGHPSLDDMDDNSTTTDPKYIAGYDATASPRTATNPDDNNTHGENSFGKCVKTNTFHGTHVAGIALGTGGGTPDVGVAPNAKLIDVKVLDYCGSGDVADIIAGIEWCITNRNTQWSGQPSAHYGIDILNLSLAGWSSAGQDAMSRAVNKAVKMGLVVVVAVGNANKSGYICTPAAADGAISVGSVNDRGTVNRADDIISSHTNWGSNRGPRIDDKDSDQMDELKPDVTAYGSSIRSALGIDPNQNGSGYHDIGGTSMATPHVAGVCALILQAHPQFQPHDVKNVLRTTAEDRNGTFNSSLDQHYDVDFGWGIVDAHAAVITTNVPPDLWISHTPRWWYSEDIWLADVPVVGQANTIYARIRNTSGTAANGATVKFQAGIFGTGQPNWLWQKSTTANVPGTGSVIASVPWTPTSAILVKGPDHPCIRVEISHTQDPNNSNNMAQKNLKIKAAASADFFTFRAWNPVDAPKKAFFGLDKLDLPEGWHAYFAPDGLFDLDYADSVDVFCEIFPSPTAELGITTSVHIAEFFQGTIAPIGGVTFSLVIKAAPTKIAIPEMHAGFGDSVFVPIIVSTDSAIGLAQFVVDYNSGIAQFIGAEAGPDAHDFSLTCQSDLPFPPSSSPETDQNVLVQLSGAGNRTFTGQDQQIVLLHFVIVNPEVGSHTPLIFDRDIERTFLTTEHLSDIRGDEIAFFDGGLRVYPPGWPVRIFVQYDLIDPPEPVPGMEVTLTQSDGIERMETTNSDGSCEFFEVPEGEISLSFSKNGDLRNAITGADALLTLRYLAFLEELSDPQRIAADVTVDHNVTGADGLAILRHLAFFPSVTDCTGRWWAMPINTPGPVLAETLVEVSAYVLGDVTLNWGADYASSCACEHSPDNLFKMNEIAGVALRLSDDCKISREKLQVPVAIQTNRETANTVIFTVEYDPACLKYQSTLKTRLSENFTIVSNGTEAGKVHIALAGVAGVRENGDILQLNFQVIEKIAAANTELNFTRAFVNDFEVINLTNAQISFTGVAVEIPTTFQLDQNYPNPFNAETIIRYGIPDTRGQQIHVKLDIYNVNGQLVRTLVDEQKAPGFHSANWDGTDNTHRPVASGIYFYQVRAAEFSSIKKMAILK